MSKFIGLIKTNKQKLLIGALIIYLLILTNKISNLEKELRDNSTTSSKDTDYLNFSMRSIEDDVCNISRELKLDRLSLRNRYCN